MCDVVGLTIPDGDISAPLQNWLNQCTNILATILVVSIGIDNDISSQA